MIQSKQRLLELNSKLAETLTNKGVTATADETTTSLINKVADITSGDDSVLRGLIQRDLTEIIIPDGVTSIGDYAFANCEKLTRIILPDSITSVGLQAFEKCRNLSSIIIPIGVTSIGFATFRYCWDLMNITIPSSVTSIGQGAFQSCSSLSNVIIGNGFNANNLNLSESTLYTRETILQWLNALADRTGQTAYKLTIGATNLAKLTEEDILIATNKNWTLA